MIFVTVGHQMPFDRLIRLVDQWAASTGRADVFAQIGPAQYRPRHFAWQEFLNQDDFAHRLQESTAVVGHAGTGSIIQSLMAGKPLLVLPRLARLGETRSDHQVGTAAHFARAGQLVMAESDDDFVRKLGAIETFRPARSGSAAASPDLLRAIRRFLDRAPDLGATADEEQEQPEAPAP